MVRVELDYQWLEERLAEIFKNKNFFHDFHKTLSALGAEIYQFKKGDVLVREGREAERFGILLEGTLHVSTLAFDRPVLIRMLNPGTFVGSSSVVASCRKYPFTLSAFSTGTVLAFSIKKVVAWRKNPASVDFFSELERQIFSVVADMSFKCAIMSQKNVAGRVMAYLEHHARLSGSRTVVIPGTEADFANYIGAHRVALSRVLNQLRAEGKIKYRRNVLTLV